MVTMLIVGEDKALGLLWSLFSQLLTMKTLVIKAQY
jgi:hypothetical protein